ncbi:SLAP domain-containing protein [Psychrobacillus vulpis]|uniref:SLAP domain-containing protein n=1 Tax=Psychrobacillus vulpis TaxID=2325572 RepID=A0A544TGP6_9BACI|nr:SLAP domain-containing protein [Psychrobacillus vulpis]
MQILKFEPSWDKALSNKDREEINAIFLETNKGSLLNVHLSPIRQVTNHRGDLLVTVLVHNFTHKELTFKEKILVYIENEIIMAKHVFTLPSLIIQPQVSMPWTFIFPANSLHSHLTLENGRLEIK